MDNEVTTVAISPDAKYIAIALLDYTIKVSLSSSAKLSIFLFSSFFFVLSCSFLMIIIEFAFTYTLWPLQVYVFIPFFLLSNASKVHLNTPFCVRVSDCSDFQ